ncbi:ATP-dependent DNA helicase, partial [Streptomyces sp. NPDC002143]
MSLMNDPALWQVELERTQVSRLYELLAERLAEARRHLADVFKASAESASEAYEREIAADRLAKRADCRGDPTARTDRARIRSARAGVRRGRCCESRGD